jgi:predicted PolB exonuclease-like 3'-5' exonuclease
MRGQLVLDHIMMRTMLEEIFMGMAYFHANNRFKKPVVVTFNGKGFDIPLLELMIHLYQMEFSQHDLVMNLLTFPDFRNKYKNTVNFDVQAALTDMSGGYFTGGLNYASKIVGVDKKFRKYRKSKNR